MKKLTITKDFGNFDVTATVEVSDIQAETLISLGALYIFERQPSSGVEQKVFGPMLGWSKGQRGTSLKRPQGFKRNSVPFSKELAQKIAEAYGTTPGKLGDTELKFTVTSCVEHIGGTETATKEGIDLWTDVQKLPEKAPADKPDALTFGDAIAGLSKFVAMTVDDYDDDRGIAACMAHLRNEKAKVKLTAMSGLKG
jgi:hypothetical protein